MKSSSETKGRILAVDDEPHILKLIDLILTSDGYEVVNTASPVTALELIEALHFDCIVTDAIMPGMNGYDLVEAIRRHPRNTNTPVIMLTRKRAPIDVKQAIKAGATDYIVKPIDEEILKQKIELAIQRGEARNPFFEISIEGKQSECELTFDARIMSFSETEIKMISSVELTEEAPFTLDSSLFKEIGIAVPFLKLVKCERKKDLYESVYTFIGLSDLEYKKIRSWLQKEVLRRRK